MNNQQYNMYGNQQQHSDEWNNWHWQWQQQQFHQSSYQQPFLPHQPLDQVSQFTVPPPPPPENEQTSTSTSAMQQQHMGARNFNPNSTNNNFNQNNMQNSNRGQNNNNRGNRRGNQRRGNNRSNQSADHGNKQFNNFQNQTFNPPPANNDSNFQANSTESNQHQGNFSNIGNRGRNQRNNWRNNRKNNGDQQQQQDSSNEVLSFTHSAPPSSYQNPSLQLNVSPISPEEELLSPEDIIFEEEFKKWEATFEDWKLKNKNHPDKRQYQLYEKQFMDVRESLLSRREEMRRKKAQMRNTTVSNPIKTPEQLAFETQWNSVPKIENENSNSLPPLPLEPTPLPSTSQLPPPESLQPNANVSAASILFGNQTSIRNNESFEKDVIDDFTSFDDKDVNRPVSFEYAKNFSIPGLEIPIVENVKDKVSKEENPDVIDLDREEVSEIPEESYQNQQYEENQSTSNIDESSLKKENNVQSSNIPIPRFRPKLQRNIVNINDILTEPKRSFRPEKIMILIRGAPGSGKHFLANLIYEKEIEINDRCLILSIDRFVKGNYDSTQTENYNQALYADCRNLVREGHINFAIVILNGCAIQQFNKISHIAQSVGHYFCYSIEIHQTRDVCETNNTKKRSLADIINAIEDLERFPTPAKISVLDPTPLLKSNNQSLNSNVEPCSSSNVNSSDPSNVNDFAQKMAKILQDKNVIEILQAQLNNVSQPQSQIQPPPSVASQNFNLPASNQFRQPSRVPDDYKSRFYQSQSMNRNLYDDIPVFKPNKTIDYNHEHMPTLEEKLMEFKIFRVIEYNHRETPAMRDFLKDIDLDKILEKRKAVALRKKILEYLRSAERPEDTVSNPKYPNNWEVIQHDRPSRRNKRKKVMTAKIKRILLQKAREENSWMTKGYNNVPLDDAMDLEEISSEDDENMNIESSPKIQKIEKNENITVSEYIDEFSDIYKTTPDFNHFNHPNVIDIRKLLMPPDRTKRPNRILIILRGASGSGKSHLVKLIKRKETEMGNEALNIRILSIDDYFEDDEDLSSDNLQEITKKYLEEMQKHLRKTLNEGLHNFIMIDADNCDLTSYIQFHQIGSSMNFAVYTIELYQSFEICLKQCNNLRSPDDIKNSINLFSQSPTPKDHILLIPSVLYAYYNCFVNPKVSNKPSTTVPFIKYLEQPIEVELLTSMPNFNWHNRKIMNIAEILENPGRFQRNEFIAILMRGPKGSGKEELASAIIEKEKQYGVEDAKFVSVVEEKSIGSKSMTRFEFAAPRDDKLEKLIKILRDIMRVKAHKFIIIDSETGDFENYMRLHELVSSYQYQCYTIELYQDASICHQNYKGESKIDEIENVLEEMQLNPTPENHILLNASMFYKQTINSSDGPLKSALKISPNTSVNLNNEYLSEKFKKLFSKLSIHSKYQAIFNQRVKINGEFIKRNEKTPSKLPEFNWFNQDITDIKDILDEPNRSIRPKKIVIFLRGAQGSGKTYLARLIERREFENGNKNVKILSVDEFFEIEQYSEVNNNKYEKFTEVNLDSSKINEYMEQLNQKFNAQIVTSDFSFIIIDGVFCDLKYYDEMYNAAKQKNFTCYTIELNQDDDICIKYNDHKWDESNVIENNKHMKTYQTPVGHLLLDPESLYHDYSYEFNANGNIVAADDEKMDTSDVSDNENIFDEDEEDNDVFETKFGKFKVSTAVASKWDDVETPDINRLDGTMKKSERVTMKDYLQSDEWSMRPSSSGKKRVRWADIEEKKEQQRMRSIGFIVGMTDWNRMTDESDGRNALEKTKYIEPRKKN